MVSECSILVRYLPLSLWIVFIMGMFCMNYLKHAMLLSSKKLLGWIFEMSEFMVICFYMFILDKESHSQSLWVSPRPRATCAIILSFIVSEALPILLYLSWCKKITPTIMSQFACRKSSLSIESCNPFIIEFKFQQSYDEPGPICYFFVAIILSRSQHWALQFLLDMPQIK